MKKFTWFRLVMITLATTFLSYESFAQEEDDLAPSTMSPPTNVDTMANPGMAMPSDGEFEAAPAPSDWEDSEGGDDEIEGEDF